MTRRTVLTCDRCGHEVGPHVYRVEKAVNPRTPIRNLRFAPMDKLDFCSMGCLLGHYGDHQAAVVNQ